MRVHQRQMHHSPGYAPVLSNFHPIENKLIFLHTSANSEEQGCDDVKVSMQPLTSLPSTAEPLIFSARLGSFQGVTACMYTEVSSFQEFIIDREVLL